MPSVDIVSKLDMQLVDNAINVANKRILQRYDLKDAKIVVELNKKDKTLKVEVPDDMKLRAVKEIVHSALMDQKVSMKVVQWGEPEDATLGTLRLKPKLLDGLEQPLAKDIVKRIKDSGLKVKASIQGDQVRVEGKQIDDLQAVMKMLNGAELEAPLQYVNMKR